MNTPKRHLAILAASMLAMLGGVDGASSMRNRVPARSPASLPVLQLESVAAELREPVAITHSGDGSGRLFISLQHGQVVLYDGAEILAKPFLDIQHKVADAGSEQGLLSVAFHPNYEQSGAFFVYYTREGDGATVVERYQVSAEDPDHADPWSGYPILVIDQPSPNHNGGQLDFGSDGFLYISVGDGGGAGDPDNNAQDPASLLGKLLRIDVDSAQGGLAYGIPADNPYVGDPGIRAEIWALGLRNPWRFSFDRASGDLFIADVGQSTWEEINHQPASSGGGENYEWPCREGAHDFGPGRPGCESPLGTSAGPILEYDHSLGCSVTGGYRYRGSLNPEYWGIYFFADYCTGRIWGAVPGGNGGWTATELADSTFNISTFGQDQGGELYLADHRFEGAIYRLRSTAFIDVPIEHWAWQSIEAIHAAGLTSGYPDGTYRPDNFVTRAELAVFLKKGIHGSSYLPPMPDGSHPFSDIAGHWGEAWIEDLYDEGFTSGYPDGSYRPENAVSRAEMAVFLKKAIHGSGYASPVPDGSHPFSDVGGHWAEAWIDDLYDEGITAGYPDGTYRPERQVPRAEIAVFLVNALPSLGP